MFSFFKRKPAAAEPASAPAPTSDDASLALPAPDAVAVEDVRPGPEPDAEVSSADDAAAPAATRGKSMREWFGFGRKDAAPTPAPAETTPHADLPASSAAAPDAFEASDEQARQVPDDDAEALAPSAEAERRGWMDRLRQGLRKTGTTISGAFTGARIDETLYEELETALLMADTGVKATEHLLQDLRRRVRDARATEPAVVRSLLADAITELLQPLESSLMVGEQTPTVIMVAGVNGAGKTTTIGKLTRHLAQAQCKVLLAAADTFRAAAREQLAVWADRNQVEIISQDGGDPSAVTFDAVKAGIARRRDVVIADTAGRLPTQLHLMEELKKLRRTITKAMPSAPHEVVLVVDGNTGQNAPAQVKAFDDAIDLTGLVVTKLDGTAKGGVLAAIALWGRERARVHPDRRGVPVYFIGVGEKLEDLQTFDAREFAQALLGL
jgi:fused signal recognition particle receptor